MSMVSKTPTGTACARTMMARHARMRRRGSRGFTLIEIMMALLVGAIVLTGVFAFSSIQQSTAALQRRKLRVQHALEGSMWAMARDVRMAGYGFSRQCTEIRIYAPDIASPAGGMGTLVNPGAADDNANLANDVALDPITQEPYWVLRDGIQAHWRSSQDNNPLVVTSDITGGADTSASVLSAADSFDVVLAERNVGMGSGAFRLESIDGTSATGAGLEIRLHPNYAPDAQDLRSMRQMFPPGSFVLLSHVPTVDGAMPFQPQVQNQCVIVQVTDEGTFTGGGNVFRVPLSSKSDFNENLGRLLDASTAPRPGAGTKPATYTGGAPLDWGPADPVTGSGGWTVSPLGQLRWSRYEIDYSVPNRPYLVRTDFISNVPSVDGGATYSATQDYPSCDQGNTCPLPQLHLPGGQVDWEDIPRVAIGPMIEDMQVSVGCDGFTAAGFNNAVASGSDADTLLSAPDPGFEELPVPGVPPGPTVNLTVDEWSDADDKGRDEWLGNAANETRGPDCVYYGTGEYRRTEWATTGPDFERGAAPGFRMSPQMLRVTLLAKPDAVAPSGNAYQAGTPAAEFYNLLFEIEDRPETPPVAPNREYYTLTETFTPKNLRWRDTRL